MGTCPSCRVEVVEGAKFCSDCGASLTGAPRPPAPAPAPPPPPPGAPRTSPGAPPTIASPWFPPPRTPPAWTYAHLPKRRTGLPTTAGVLLIISGVLAMIVWGLVILVGGSFYESIIPGAATLFCICGAIEFIFAIIMVTGGVMALDRRMWGLGLAGSILGLFTIGFVFETSIMSLVALILLAISRDEFR